MADHAKATKHHKLAGKALSSGDHKAAAHHMGHAMSALRTSAFALPTAAKATPPKAGTMAPEQEGGEGIEPAVMPPSKLRGMLSRFKQP